MASKEEIVCYVKVTLKRSNGKRQDEDAFTQALVEDIEGLGDIWAQDDEHDEESSYEVKSASVVFPTAFVEGTAS